MVSQADYLGKAPNRTGGRGDYGFSNAPKPPAPPAPTGQYPGPLPTYGPPKSYGPPPVYPGPQDYGPPPVYRFDPQVDPVAVAQNERMERLIRRQMQQEAAARQAELFQIRSQYQAPRQSRITMLGGY